MAEELGVPLNQIKVISNDTDLTPYDLGSWGSRTTYMSGNAVLAAARDTKKTILAVAAEMFSAGPEDIVMQDGEIFVKGSADVKHSLAQVAEYAVDKRGLPISGRGNFNDKLPAGITIKDAFIKNIATFSFGTQVADVEVNPETGEVKVLSVVAAHESGKTINITMAEGQIEGSVVQGIGYALMEKMVLDNGRVVNDGFLDYKIPNIGDIPEIKAILVETGDPHGPLGAKGIGEPGLVPTAAAIANAIYHATGVRMKELPITPEKLLKALKEKQNEGRAE